MPEKNRQESEDPVRRLFARKKAEEEEARRRQESYLAAEKPRATRLTAQPGLERRHLVGLCLTSVLVICLFIPLTCLTLAPSRRSPVVTQAEYDRLEHGMSYDEAVRIIGARGEVRIRSSPGEPDGAIYEWHNEDGSNMIAIFENGRLLTKADNTSNRLP